MTACNVEVIKHVGKYLNISVGSVCYNTDKVLTTVVDKQNVEGFASIVLRLAAKSGDQMSQDQKLLSYQWLEYVAMYGNQAASNPTFARGFLEDINRALQKNTYLTGQFVTITDIAVYHALYPLLDRLSIAERESLLHVCRWSKHIQALPKVCASRPPLPMNTLILSAGRSVKKALAEPLPRQLLPHELQSVKLDKPVVFHPQPFAYPGYPAVVYL